MSEHVRPETSSPQSSVARPHAVGVVIPAGGAGVRMGGPPKQYRLLGDAPVLVQTVRAFCRHPTVGPVVVVAPAERVAETRALLDGFGVDASVVAGGPSRQASVRKGLAELPARVSVVLVHDAVRPFVPAALITRVVDAVERHGAAAAALPVADTLRDARDGVFGKTVRREGRWAMQTPQGARRHLFDIAYARVAEAGVPETDEAGLLSRAGLPVVVVEGDARNIKVTRPSDWDLAQALWTVWAHDESTARTGAASG